MVIARFIILLLIILMPLHAWAKISAYVDRNSIDMGDTFQLVLESDDESPELDVLEQQFNVLGTSRSSSVSIINGSMTSVKKWIVTLAPKSLGVFVIPPIKAGSEATAPIRIEVKKPVAQTATQGADIFLEAKADVSTAYVQSQIVYSVRLYRAVEIRDASLTEPNLDDVVIERLGEDITFRAQRNQRTYQVTERRYAIFPQKSGKISIPASVFQGQVPDRRNAQNTNDPFNNFIFNQRMKRVRVQSEAVEVDVLAQPTDTNGQFWLPAKELTLAETWSPEPPVFRVGEPVTRTLRMQAIGLTGAQLPELKAFIAHGVKQYNDQPVVDTQYSNDSLVGIREEKFAIIPTASGKLVLPEMRLYWWDTEFDKEKVVTIPPKIIEVLPAKNATPEAKIPDSSVEPATDNMETAKETAKEVVKIVREAGNWPIIALILGLGWLLTLIFMVFYWLKNRKLQSSNDSPNAFANNSVSMNAAKTLLKKACSENDPAAAKQAILAWSTAAFPENSPRSLSKLAEALHDSTLKQIFNELNKVLYAQDSAHWSGSNFWDVVSGRLKLSQQKMDKKLKSLPALYPQHS